MTTFTFLHFFIPVAFFTVVAILTHAKWVVEWTSESVRQLIVVVCIIMIGATIADFMNYRYKEIIEQLMKN